MRFPFPPSFYPLWVCLLFLCFGCQKKQEEVVENQSKDRYQVIAIKDGDTVELLKDGKPLRVRLHGIDCPEKNQDFGTKARQFTSDLAFGKFVKLVVHDIDRYGRTVGEIILPDGRNLNYELVKYGFAWHYKAYSKDPELARLELAARLDKQGLWAGPNPQAPWDFRKRKSPTSAKTAAAAKKATTTSATISNKNGKAYVCESKGATTYHLNADCARLKSCKSSIGTVSQAQAKKQNRSACKVCAV